MATPPQRTAGIMRNSSSSFLTLATLLSSAQDIATDIVNAVEPVFEGILDDACLSPPSSPVARAKRLARPRRRIDKISDPGTDEEHKPLSLAESTTSVATSDADGAVEEEIMWEQGFEILRI